MIMKESSLFATVALFAALRLQLPKVDREREASIQHLIHALAGSERFPVLLAGSKDTRARKTSTKTIAREQNLNFKEYPPAKRERRVISCAGQCAFLCIQTICDIEHTHTNRK